MYEVAQAPCGAREGSTATARAHRSRVAREIIGRVHHGGSHPFHLCAFLSQWQRSLAIAFGDKTAGFTGGVVVVFCFLFCVV